MNVRWCFLEKEKEIGEQAENDVLQSYDFLDLMLVDKKKVEFLKEHGFHDRLLYVHGELSKIWCDLWKINKKFRDLAMFEKEGD